MIGSEGENEIDGESVTRTSVGTSVGGTVKVGRRVSGSRNYVFTHNAPPSGEDGGRELYNWGGVGNVKYAVWQEEVAPTTNRTHHQGYIEFEKPVRFTTLRNKLPNGGSIHFEPRKGTADQAREYCMKEDTRHAGPWEHGIWISSAGRATRSLKNIYEKCAGYLAEGRDAAWIAENDPAAAVRCRSLIQDHTRKMLVRESVREKRTRVNWLEGEPGTGKTSLVSTLTSDREAYWKGPGSAKFWDGYTGQRDVVVDDIDEESLSRTQFLRAGDRNPLILEVKGAVVPFKAYRMFITSNVSIAMTYPKATEAQLAACMRRVDVYGKFTRGRHELEGFIYVHLRVQDVECGPLGRPQGSYKGITLPYGWEWEDFAQKYPQYEESSAYYISWLKETKDLLHGVLGEEMDASERVHALLLRGNSADEELARFQLSHSAPQDAHLG